MSQTAFGSSVKMSVSLRWVDSYKQHISNLIYILKKKKKVQSPIPFLSTCCDTKKKVSKIKGSLFASRSLSLPLPLASSLCSLIPPSPPPLHFQIEKLLVLDG